MLEPLRHNFRMGLDPSPAGPWLVLAARRQRRHDQRHVAVLDRIGDAEMTDRNDQPCWRPRAAILGCLLLMACARDYDGDLWVKMGATTRRSPASCATAMRKPTPRGERAGSMPTSTQRSGEIGSSGYAGRRDAGAA